MEAQQNQAKTDREETVSRLRQMGPAVNPFAAVADNRIVDIVDTRSASVDSQSSSTSISTHSTTNVRSFTLSPESDKPVTVFMEDVLEFLDENCRETNGWSSKEMRNQFRVMRSQLNEKAQNLVDQLYDNLRTSISLLFRY